MKAPRLSIRYKMLLVVSLTLVLAMSAYLYLAVTMFRQDKLTDVFVVVTVSALDCGVALEKSAHSIRSVPSHMLEHVSAVDRLGELA